ncbi:ATP-binding protein [Spirulina subsalsa FACHB-351]|uniref:ATP-binding protein n=1 Tax=Spirulina subsalsa FACHB-351 TaxID=234711 RepID=A0ABT3L758_9CYAN|nr:ATP-binding protein [Spirulina subsalsa]MCW6037343.1 ATP-binding protein [Spirulina subsalsa FACHB-351]
MMIEVLSLLASAGLGVMAGESFKWAQQKAGERNHDVEKALLNAHDRSLKEILTCCQKMPEWEDFKDELLARIQQIKQDGEQILIIVEGEQPQGSEGSWQGNQQQTIGSQLMERLEREHQWLREAPPVLVNTFRSLYVPSLVHYFRLEIKYNTVVFNTLTYDLLNQIGEQVGDTEQKIRQIRDKLDQGIDRFIASFPVLDERFNQLLTTLKGTIPVPADFAAFIEEKTQEFFGREFVFNAIEEFCQKQAKGYFIIEADPGVGKSALLAQYVQQTGCLAYFNILSENRTSTEDFLGSICAQLIERYGLAYDLPLHPDNTRNGNFLSKLLTEAAAKTDRLVIAVDALDEVDLSTQNRGQNVLYLPENLPKGVYFVLTKRPDFLPFVVAAPQQEFDMMSDEYYQANLADIQGFIRYRCQREPTQRWLAAQGVTEAEFIEFLAENSETNFMYLKYVLDDIEQGKYAALNLANLPRGLQQYYEQHWRRMGMVTKPLPRTKLKIIYLLSKTQKPVSCDLLADFAEEDPLTVQEVLDEWEQFLRHRIMEDEEVYSIYHKSFQEFLFNRRTVQKAGVSLRDIELDIVDNLWDGLYGEDENNNEE